MEQPGTERYETYPTETLPNPHPEAVRSSYHPENLGERALSPPIFVRPLGPAVQLPRKPRSIMYKAKAHDLLIYASLIISALALILATRNGRQDVEQKGKEMMHKTSEITQMVPQPGNEQQTQQHETVIHLKLPPYPPPTTPPSLISPVQKFIAYLHPATLQPVSLPEPVALKSQEMAMRDLLRALALAPALEADASGLSYSNLKVLEKLLEKDTLIELEKDTLDVLLRHLSLELDQDELPLLSPGRRDERHHHRLQNILEILHPRSHKRAEEKNREREKALQEKEAELTKRERAVVDALNVLDKEKE